MTIRPELGVLALVLAMGGAIAGAYFHVDVALWASSLGAFGVAVLSAASHARAVGQRDEARAELEQLHKSLMPPREPSMASLPPLPANSTLPKDPAAP